MLALVLLLGGTSVFAGRNNSVLSVAQAERTITGVVKDDAGAPILGAIVLIDGTNISRLTDAQGRYSIPVPAGATLIVFSYLGTETQSIPIESRGEIDVTLSSGSVGIEEVIVTGYGTQRKASLTSAISQVRGDEVFGSRGISGVATALQGEIPGLVVTRGSTRPGSENAAFKIRGDISVNGNSSPLILIDGVAGSMDELNSMNSTDIENISVLKDASAAIYGARSASGVILVTTKRGTQGKAQITYNASLSRTIDGIQPPLATNAQFLDMFYEGQYWDAAAANPTITDPQEIHNRVNWWIFNSFGGTPLGGGEVIVGEDLFNALRAGQSLALQRGSNVDHWEPNNYMMDFLYGQANSQKHALSISGADDKFGYRASFNFSDADSQLRVAEDGEKKYGLRFNSDYKASDYLKIETGVSYEKRNITTPHNGVGQGFMDPWFWPVYNENGDAYDTFSGSRNPVGQLTQGGTNKTGFNTLRATGKATYDLSRLTEGLSISGQGAYKVVEKNYQELRLPVYWYDWVGTQTGSQNAPGFLRERIEKWTNITLGGFVNYERTFAGKHNVEGMLGMTAEQEDYKSILAGRQNGATYPGSDLVDLNVWTSGTNNQAEGGQHSWGFVSFLTRLNYDYAGKYLVEFLGRRDGSSKLAESQRWKNFYSISGGWVLSRENFLKDASWLNFLKVRYNYGKTGSVEGIGNYERYATMGTGNLLLGTSPANQPSLWLGGMTSDTRTWETIVSHNAGFDFTVLNNRLSGEFNYFTRTNEGMFIDVTYPAVLGATAPKTNNGKFRSKGWEFSLDWKDRVGDFRYNIGGWVSDASSKVLELTNNENVPNAGKNSNRLVGMPRDAYYVYRTDGLFQTQEQVDAYYDSYYWNADRTGPKQNNILPAPSQTALNRLRPGARKVVDLDGDGAITTKDLYYAGDAAPRVTFGFKLGLEWKGIDLQAFFQGVAKQTILRSGYIAFPWTANYTLQNGKYLGRTWTPDRTDAEFPIMSRDSGFNGFNYFNKDTAIQNNTYLRLKSLVVGYSLPNRWTTKAGIEKVRVYFSADDLFEFTAIKDGFDPEYGENSNNTFPFSRLLTVGIDVTF